MSARLLHIPQTRSSNIPPSHPDDKGLKAGLTTHRDDHAKEGVHPFLFGCQEPG